MSLFESSELIDLIPRKYSEIEQLSPGKNAVVFSACDSYLDRRVFLKIYAIPENDPASALREPRNLEALTHQNLTKIYSADELEGGYLLLGMELVDGGSFQDLIDSQQNEWQWNSTSSLISLVTDVANGLSHLHLKRFVHRDIKPANLVIRQVGAASQGVVTDLGFACKMDENDKAYTSRHAKLYRPPEVWEGHGYGPSSDIYQLGMTLYQLLGGKLDYDLSEDEVAERALGGSLLDFETLIPCTPKSLQGLIRICVSRREERFPAMHDFILRLNNIRTNEPDWSCHVFNGETHIFRKDSNTRNFRYIVRSIKNTHVVTREKKVKDGEYRRDGDGCIVNHKQLTQSQKFHSFLKK